MAAVLHNDVDSGVRSQTFAPFAGQKAALLTTFRRDGTPVGTPVSVYVDEEGRAFFRTWDTAGKMKRIRHNPLVEIAPSTFWGEPTGPAIRARARLLTGAEARHAAAGLASKHPILHRWVVPAIHRLRGNRTVHFELTPIDED